MPYREKALNKDLYVVKRKNLARSPSALQSVSNRWLPPHLGSSSTVSSRHG